MVKRFSLLVVFAISSALLAVGNNAISFAGNPMLAGRASLTENGFVVTRTIGVANFSPEFRIPVQINYESSSERKGIFGYGWRSPPAGEQGLLRKRRCALDDALESAVSFSLEGRQNPSAYRMVGLVFRGFA